MHSSRMHTICNSNHLWGGVPGPRGCTWSQGVYLVPGECTWSRGVPGPGVYLVWGWVPAQVLPPWTDTHVYKHNLRNLVGNGKNLVWYIILNCSGLIKWQGNRFQLIKDGQKVIVQSSYFFVVVMILENFCHKPKMLLRREDSYILKRKINKKRISFLHCRHDYKWN